MAYDITERSPIAAELDACLVDLPDPRGRVAFELDDLLLATAESDALAPTHELIGLGHDWMRRLKYDAREHVRAAFAESSLAATITELAECLGEVVDTAGIHDALAALDLPPPTDPAGLLAVWLAGPYRPIAGFDGWWSPRPAEVVKATTDLVASSGGVHVRETVITDLCGLGVSAACAERWLARQRVRMADGVVVDVAGRPRDVAKRVLEATGRAMTCGELRAWLPEGSASATGLLGELRRHSGFVETGPDQWELAEWGGEPSSHLVHIDVAVTEDVLTGDEAEVPTDVAALLGLAAGSSLKLSTRFGPLVMSYDGVRVARGSARPVVLASGAAVGDVVSFVIDPRSHAVQVAVVAAQPS